MGVLGGGCSGFQYSLSVVSDPDPDWNKFEFNGVTIVVDQLSMMYLEDVTLDYEESLAQSGFKFINPQVKSTCGCGQSFSM